MSGVLLLLGVPGDPESAGAREWARLQGLDAQPVLGTAEVRRGRRFWCHAGAAPPEFGADTLEALQGAVTEGATLLLTSLATPVAQSLGAPAPAPVVEGPMEWRHALDPAWPDAFREWPGYPHIRGAQAWGAHALLDGLHGGTYTWMAREGDRWSCTTLPRREAPAGVGVIAVDRAYVALDPDRAVAWEYAIGRGRVVCVGSGILFTSGDETLHPQRDALLHAALALPAERGHESTWWPGAPRHAAVVPMPLPAPVPGLAAWVSPRPRVRLDAPDESPWTMGMPLGLATGTEAGGVGELWLHPLCVVDGGVRVDAPALACVEATVSPCAVTRTLAGADGRWREILTGSRTEPAWGYELQCLEGDGALTVHFALAPRIQWPLPTDALWPVRVEAACQGPAAVLRLTGTDGQHVVQVRLDGLQTFDVGGEEGRTEVKLTTAPGGGVRVLFQASTDGRTGLAAMSRGLRAMAEEQDAEAIRRQATTAVLVSDSPALDEGWRWAAARLASFVSGAPGAPGLMAGYAATRPGWGVSRPGYAWHFGRDTCWCVDALLAAGMFDEARVAIDRLIGTMDVSGKVAHEITTGGVVHYDAADATPLLLRAAAMYGEWSADRATLHRWYPALRRAFDFVRRCDRDNDGLPENDRVGHGWIEMGPLGGGHVTSYVAAVWIDALRRLEGLCQAMADEGWRAEVAESRRAAERGLERLRLPDGRLALHRTVTGELEDQLTALDAVPVAVGVVQPAAAALVLDALWSEEWRAGWGIRLIARRDPLYQPRGYHAGAVWPLFTGWTVSALARAGRRDAAWSLLQSVAGLVRGRSKGAFDEVLDGDSGGAAGVCPDQAWSAAACIAPLVHGILGVAPNAWEGRIDLHVGLPEGVSKLSLTGLRVADARLDLLWARDPADARAECSAVWRRGQALDVGASNLSRVATVSSASRVAHFSA